MTSDSDVLLQLLRLHGYSLMSHILKNHKGDIPITTLVSSDPYGKDIS